MNLEHNGAGSDGLRGTSSWKALASGAAGAATVTLAHEVVRQLVPTGAPALRREKLRGYTLIGDLAGSALFFAPLAIPGKRPLLRGLAFGIVAGLGAVMLTPLLELPRRRRGVTLRTQAITVALYALGGVAAAAMASLLNRPTRARTLGPDITSDPYLAAIASGVAPQTGEW